MAHEEVERRSVDAIRMPVWIWTHDSVAPGGDGPTHQPVEHLLALRAMPGLRVVRPADAGETAEAWRLALERTDGPTALALSRQPVPVLDRSRVAPADGVRRGGYVLRDPGGAVGIDRFGPSAPGGEVLERTGIAAERMAGAARALAGGRTVT